MFENNSIIDDKTKISSEKTLHKLVSAFRVLELKRSLYAIIGKVDGTIVCAKSFHTFPSSFNYCSNCVDWFNNNIIFSLDFEVVSMMEKIQHNNKNNSVKVIYSG